MKTIKYLLMLAGLLMLCSLSLSAQRQPPDFPMWCHGSPGVAQAKGRTLTVVFNEGTVPAGESLKAGVCSWLDRGLRPGEPTRIVDVRPSAGEARNTAREINEGAYWTFWVYNAGTYMKATTSFTGRVKNKPVKFDNND